MVHTYNFCKRTSDTPKGLRIHLASCNRKRIELIYINLQSTPSDNVQETSHVVACSQTLPPKKSCTLW